MLIGMHISSDFEKNIKLAGELSFDFVELALNDCKCSERECKKLNDLIDAYNLGCVGYVGASLTAKQLKCASKLAISTIITEKGKRDYARFPAVDTLKLAKKLPDSFNGMIALISEDKEELKAAKKALEIYWYGKKVYEDNKKYLYPKGA
ncbi:hypothetical protein COT30_03060 [Candidatus Micrarchaeota archaeon CG08_land_8_20_14_0_20_49_17]|nr:MAG: hypothetical protein AUJ13_02465 [Candidatus Micrarchaeota archaeon CG1_02_49_24]PIU09690.1 MAG: hypothetical protein COT30_03060 [Candidatus Micrarchaeota archaeon CG08_land_8_20_14_0_20_49_17]PIU81650.1 MAG: hypothetical protein COS70_02960 [Candidatus Micrarchaeota archaeon CG06_land_8_20_14_3_00_50_6]PIZ93075.1 MAG: hypothetical protein COX84_06225 [Candidatus Micrarchaeota archaeon CG_4_10_14_0_2_um_filter_49_7]HII54329.1 hypothetical protein [Candidatus Micrarchaeota archaeon]